METLFSKLISQVSAMTLVGVVTTQTRRFRYFNVAANNSLFIIHIEIGSERETTRRHCSVSGTKTFAVELRSAEGCRCYS